MASIRKDGYVWRVQVARKNPAGQTVRKSGTFDSKREAEEWAAEIEREIRQGAAAKDSRPFSKALERYRDEVSVTKRGEKWEKDRIGLMMRDDLAQVKLCELDETHIAAWRDRRLRVVSPASVRREWNLLSSICTVAVNEWKWLAKHPMKLVKRPPPPRARDRLATDAEVAAILHCLGYSDEWTPVTLSARVGAAVVFAIETAMRAGEICALTWADIDTERLMARVTGETHGAGKTQAAIREVPLSPVALRVINQLSIENKLIGSVFGLSTRQVDALFRKARSKACVDDLHFHDFRHLAITRLARMPGMNVLTLSRIVGHRDLRQLQIYYNESAEDIAKRLWWDKQS